MQQKEIRISVFFVPGGESASLSAYEKFAELLEAHADMVLSVYSGQNKYDGRWSLVLIGEKTSFSQYQEQIQQLLSEVSAQAMTVPSESLIPLVESFLKAQVEMALKNQTFVEKHHPLSKKYYAKKRVRRSKRGEKGGN